MTEHPRRRTPATAPPPAPRAVVDTAPHPGVTVLAAATAVTAVVALALAVTTPARAGAFCRTDCVGYPYTDVAAFVPRDYLWMYPGLLVALLFVALAVTLGFRAAPRRRPVAATAAAAAAIGATLLVADYGVQLMVLQPALAAGEADGLSPWSQYDPHGVFIALENLGYALFGAAFVLLGVAFAGATGGVGRAARLTLVVGGALILALLAALAAVYGADLDVRFEVAGLSLSWLVLAVTGSLVAVSGARREPRARPYSSTN